LNGQHPSAPGGGSAAPDAPARTPDPAAARVRVTVVADTAALAQTLAERFRDAARRAVAERGLFRVALAGGSTPEAAYALLARSDGIPWSAVEVFWGDERPVPPDHPDSNYRMAHEALLAHVPVAPGHVHRMRGEAQDLEAAALDYAAELAAAFGVGPDGPPPRFDLILLGMGGEGHTASLFPDSPALADPGWVAAPFVPQLGMRRLTLTPRVLNRAAEVVFAVAGASKAAALRAVLGGPRQPARYPAQVVAPPQGFVEWIVERALAERAGLVGGG
jgi:6-phosphogluconolactonase